MDSSSAHECVQAFYRVHQSESKISVLGHSFGAGIATFSLLEKLATDSIMVENVITMDPRNGSNDGRYLATREQFQFEKPGHVAHFLNFRQRGGGLPGYSVTGAENIRVQGTTHVGLPRNEEVLAGARRLLLQTTPSEVVTREEDVPQPDFADVSQLRE